MFQTGVQGEGQGLDDKEGSRCPKCHFREDLCLCVSAPSLESRACFFLLVHSRELNKRSNTGHLIVRCIDKAQYAVWSRVEEPTALMSLLQSNHYQPYVLFPAQRLSTTQTTVVEQVAAEKPPLFILLEGTWQEAAKMYRQSPYLQSLPVMSLKPQQTSQYGLRRNQKTEGLATVEIAIELLEQLQEQQQARDLQQYFQQFLLHYEAQRSQRPL
ncbi:tRNA-uridine aminocarboxypropyltransferase [Maricurvus nonylphenolicus]|uniref:tRNA-uridine aminocarboxypropyltransferase n=1 Tax=Maricurvus nonylphenolicus TaxID=1008307 RepID=UPI0036F1956A